MKRVKNLLIRHAEQSDSKNAAELVVRAMGRFADVMFPPRNGVSPHVALSKLFAQKFNRFSHEYADVAENGGDVAGILISYSGWMIPLLALPTGAQLVQACGLSWAGGRMKDTRAVLRMREAMPEEYYINDIAVSEKFAGRGIGTQLMKHAEVKAKRASLRKCSLTVDVLNEGAIRLYERLGYRIVGTQNLNRVHIHRMVKQLQ